ncbi:MAG: Fe2+-dependent dioxygenase [Burkholderiales bacterium]|nr:Fe2+-dependent dioxygenase [Burkholderiales bacterium]MCZ2134085.1 Fe2+-dependent dioxygenase [Burkholderiales bacterium]
MLLHVPDVLTATELAQAERILDAATWQDGRRTAGEQAVIAKNNQQLDERSDPCRRLQALVLAAIERNTTLFSATLAREISPPLFNRYAGANNTFGNHVDSAIRYVPATGARVRTDISCTLFLRDPSSYDGGELVIEDTFGHRRVKLPAGHLVVYPGTSVHRVEPVTRGERIACFFWVQSMVRSDEQRRLLFDMDNHLRHLRSTIGETDPAVVGLTGTYHNLLRQWMEL